ncbi:hypothetical protein [Novosphingobium jiangmenense]|uniref:Uncharacterized protein n=1 Tax=Novosphingobium jiangmenense TaxID=2791981 RepID=A0ABS0HCN2_9SPHN|nr:hypothetical protein [Novosphingobium jiangmenense]MBF9150034.1 hypothetical protein [Novosphingobium jiangmenense]
MAAPNSFFLGIDPKMYRHFAVITVGLSTVVALFANGDAQEAMAQSQQHAEHQAAKARTNKAKLVDKRSDSRRSGGSGGYTGRFGAPMDGGAAASGNSSVIPVGMAVAPAQIIIEVDQKALARMTPEQRAAYLRKLEEERQRRMEQGPVMPTPEQVSALAAQSAARSGSDEID